MATVYSHAWYLGETIDANDGVTNGDDTIYGSTSSDEIYGLGGDDVIYGGGGSGIDDIYGGSGNDTVVCLDSNVFVIVDLGLGEGFNGTADGDEYFSIENVTGSFYDDVLVGDGGDNVLNGHLGDDGLIGQGGNDTLIGGLGADELIGGSGTDTASYAGALSGVAASLAAGSGTIGDAAGDTFETIENLTGSFFADTLTGDANANTLDGDGGNDDLKGGGGGDTLIGGTGTDTALYTDSSVGVTVNLISGLGFDGTAEGDTLDDIENVSGSVYADDLTGDANANRLFGSSGDDTLKGGGGADTLDGSSGVDTVRYGDSASGVTVELLTGTGSGGTAEDDTLISIENLVGSVYADTLTGDEDANELSGSGGDDWLKGGGGADTLDGGTGNDTATYLNYGSGVTVSLLTGTGSGSAAQGDTLTNIENLYGTAYADLLIGDAGANILHGDGGDDVLKGAGGADRLIGGSGVDTATYVGSSAVTVNLTSGIGSGGWAQGDTLTGIENIVGSSSGDTLVGDTDSNDLLGEGGNDTLWGGAGADTLDGSTGTDTATYIEFSAGVDVNLLTGTGTGGTAEGDTLTDVENLIGSLFDDDLTGDDEGNVLLGGIGIDELVGNGGNDTLEGGFGDDWLVGGAGGDTLTGGNGFDFILYDNSAAGVTVNLATASASGGDATGDTFTSIEHVAGSGFGDLLTGNAGNNMLKGAGGDDTLVGGLGADFLAGFTGIDTVSYAASTAAVTVDLAAGTGSGGDAAGDSFSDIENVYGSDFADTLTGDGDGNMLDGRGSADTMAGNGGDDTYFVNDALDVVTEADAQGNDTVLTSVSYTLAVGADVEVLRTTDDTGTEAIDLTGSAFDNEITGNDGANVITGGGGADHLVGRNGDDTYIVDSATDTITENGGQGIDTVQTSTSFVLTAGADVETLETTDDDGTAAIDLSGNANGNIVRGNAGSNVINGGNGRDTLTGLGGQDSFLFDTPLDAATNLDVVTDFTVADDTILLENTIFGAFAAGALAAERFVIGTAALDANDNIIYDSGTGALFYDSDGAGGNGAVQFAELSAGLALTNLDFLVV